jgi:hypothetical protein
MGSDIQKKEDQSTVVAYHREGFNDKPVEIFRDSQIFEAYLSQVRIGDCFHTLERPSMWFQCTVPILRSYMSWDRERANPTFNVGSCVVMQAAPTVERQPALSGPSHRPYTPHLIESDKDVIDVDMKLIGKD